MIHAVSDRIVLKPESVQEQVGGVFIPDSSKTKPMKGVAVSIGEGVKWIRVGNEVIFLAGHGVVVDDVIIIKEGDVLGYIETINTE